MREPSKHKRFYSATALSPRRLIANARWILLSPWEWTLVLEISHASSVALLYWSSGKHRTRPKVPPHRPHFLRLHPVTQVKHNTGAWMCVRNRFRPSLSHSHTLPIPTSVCITVHFSLCNTEHCGGMIWWQIMPLSHWILQHILQSVTFLLTSERKHIQLLTHTQTHFTLAAAQIWD